MTDGVHLFMMYLDEAAVHKLVKPAELIDAMREAFIGSIHSPQRTHHQIPGSEAARMLLMPSWRVGGAIGVKVVTLDPERTKLGAPSLDGLYLLMDGITGVPQTIIAARALTAIRTAAVSALAASYLAREDASTFLLVGPGNLAPHIIAAHCAVRAYKRVLIWGRDSKKGNALRDSVTVDAEVVVAKDLAHAVAQADVISCATSSTEPLILKRDVKPGTHVDLIGSYTPHMREAEGALFERARVFADAKSAILECGDLLGPCSEGFIGAESIPDLSELIRTPSLGRANKDEITIFKAAGTATADLAAAEYLLARHNAIQQPPTLTADFGEQR